MSLRWIVYVASKLPKGGQNAKAINGRVDPFKTQRHADREAKCSGERRRRLTDVEFL